MRTIYWWPLSTCATNLRRGEKQNWNRDFGGKVDQVGEAGQSRALPGHLCWICIFCTFVFLLLCWICIICSLIFRFLCWICICSYFCISSSKGSLKICLTCVMLVVFIYIVDWPPFEVGLYPFRAILFLWKYLKEICLCGNFTISGKDFWRMSLKNFFHTQLYWSVQDSLSKLNFIHSRLRQIEAWVNQNFYFDFSRSENLV